VDVDEDERDVRISELYQNHWHSIMLIMFVCTWNWNRHGCSYSSEKRDSIYRRWSSRISDCLRLSLQQAKQITLPILLFTQLKFL